MEKSGSGGMDGGSGGVDGNRMGVDGVVCVGLDREGWLLVGWVGSIRVVLGWTQLTKTNCYICNQSHRF